MESQKLIDSNVLIYALNAASSKHTVALGYLEKYVGSYTLAHQNVLETWRVLSHPSYIKAFGGKGNLGQQIGQLISAADEMIFPNELTLQLFEKLTQRPEVSGNHVFDAYLVATMLTNGVDEMVTDNERDMTKFPEIRVVNPFK